MKTTNLLHPEVVGEDLAATAETLQRGLQQGLSWRRNLLGEVKDKIYVVGPSPTWHVVGAGGEPAFQNGWAAYGAPYGAPRFTMELGGKVVVEGLHKKNTAIAVSTMWALPSGYRPAADRILSGVTDNGAALPALPRVDVLANGNVNFIATSAGAGGAGFLSMNSSFYADPLSCAAPDLRLSSPLCIKQKSSRCSECRCSA